MNHLEVQNFISDHCTYDSKFEFTMAVDGISSFDPIGTWHHSPIMSYAKLFEIKRVIFHDPATIVFWKDGTKTVVKVQNEAFDPEKGLAMALAKRVFGNSGNYYNIFRKWIPEKSEKGQEP